MRVKLKIAAAVTTIFFFDEPNLLPLNRISRCIFITLDTILTPADVIYREFEFTGYLVQVTHILNREFENIRSNCNFRKIITIVSLTLRVITSRTHKSL